MATSTKTVTKSEPVIVGLDSAALALGELRESAASFTRKTIRSCVEIVGQLTSANEGVSHSALFKALSERTENDGYGKPLSAATLHRYSKVADIHAKLGVAPSDGSASAVYSLTESGQTAARKAVESLESVEDADALVDAVVTAINSNPKTVKAIAQTAESAETADYTLESFTASVTELIGKAGNLDPKAVAKALRILGENVSKGTVGTFATAGK